VYEDKFLELMAARQVEKEVSRDVLKGGCLLCSEEKSHHCHRRLVAEYLQNKWGAVEIRHLGRNIIAISAAGLSRRLAAVPG